ncbi:NADH dehydrogenase-like protein YjlD [Koleobacter methoxysyntrophicus]|uniref:NADH:ubiquinone reductase (non-electrogenic) n=1 Tax=Koleobacter methoxysyntrophicus TaxID=2751313 RepID=A0A8A0RHT7_9FIRM|nr:FAD-dependent oxidoreductase [Koleobacter methoxysyntrophicus]QSQ07763.1 NADH dehydrogenase-like protein YjlD [Koleobacter methoxysyntrophicus]
MSNEKKIVILGAGYGGVHAAKLFHKKFKKKDNIKITLIDKNPFHTLMTDLHEIAGARVEKEAVKVNLKGIFAGKKVEVITDEIKDIDFKKKKLISENTVYEYDYLVIGTGAEPAFFGIPGAEEYGLTIWSLEDALKIRKHIEGMFDKASREKNPEKRREMLTFAVAGAGFTGVEVIGELAEWKKKLCSIYGIDKNEVRLFIIEALPNILPMLESDLQAKAAKHMKKMGIEVVTNTPIVEVKKDAVALKDGTVIPTRTLIWTAGVQGNSFAAKLGLTIGKKNRVQANKFMQSVDYSNVYLIGDNGYLEEDGKTGYPQIVESALQTAETAVHNIIADIENAPKKPFKPNYHGFMVSIGSRYAVANVVGIKLSGFFAMAVKHLVNLHYLFGVGGFALCIKYLMHEFFDIKDNRSILGGHLSNKIPILWLLPLRIFVGYKWLGQGIQKLPKILEDPSNIFLIPAPVKDAVSSATQAAADAATSATPAGESAVSQWGQALPVPGFIEKIVDWSMQTFFYTPEGGFTVWAQVFQAAMVIGEIVIGLCLIAGLFTTLASIASVGMGLMIWASGMAPLEMLWYLAAGIALIGGAGRAFGLDYYVIPVIKDWWKKNKLAYKTYLFIE